MSRLGLQQGSLKGLSKHQLLDPFHVSSILISYP
ncbi:UNVERIFIED_CONTAM: hypothetical protein ABID98_003341 [Brevibacillus sp. OAP136]